MICIYFIFSSSYQSTRSPDRTYSMPSSTTLALNCLRTDSGRSTFKRFIGSLVTSVIRWLWRLGKLLAGLCRARELENRTLPMLPPLHLIACVIDSPTDQECGDRFAIGDFSPLLFHPALLHDILSRVWWFNLHLLFIAPCKPSSIFFNRF